jgi:uncharacterized protein involved in cysteine biosynthesis
MGIFLRNVFSEPSVAPLFVNIVLLVLCFYWFVSLVNDSIAQQQGTGTAK